jgi:hypothetical protein
MPPEPRTRNLYPWEVMEAQRVFAQRLDYGRVRVHENVAFPDTLDKYSRIVRRAKALEPGTHNAMTIGCHCYFPITLPEFMVQPNDPTDYILGWLIHELTHAYQYQHMGWKYLPKALATIFKMNDEAYRLPDIPTLIQKHVEGFTFFDLTVEQQGSLTQRFYYAQRDPVLNQPEYEAYLPYIHDVWNAP